MAVWPSTLPTAKASGYQLSPSDQTVRSEMEVGYARQRRRTSARNDQISLAWFFTDAQMLIFRDWFDDDVAGGQAWIGQMPVALGNGVETTFACRFIGPWQASLASAPLLWNVTAKIEVR